MKWNYRVVKLLDGCFSICEVYYTIEGDTFTPSVFCNGSLNTWEEFDDLKGTYELMGDAFNKPILIEQPDHSLVKDTSTNE